MTQFQKISLVLLRLTLGWMFLYAGITKLINPAWTAAGYLSGAKTFPELYAFFMRPDILPVIDFLNMWGLTLIGAALILGIFVRLASVAGLLLMILYYLPILQFPHPNPNSYIVDLAAFRAGRVWGLEKTCVALPICSRFPRLRALLG